MLTGLDRVLPRFQDEHDEVVEFGLGLIKYKEELLALPQTEGQTSNAELLDDILEEILAEAIPWVYDRYRQEQGQAVSSLFSICIPGNRMKRYRELLDLISRPYGDSFYTRYVDVYAKAIPDLVKLLDKHGISVSSSPSRKFFRHVIGKYLEEILGSKEGSPYLKLPMLTCGHEACSQVNDFLRSEEMKTTVPLDEVEDCVADLKIDKRYKLVKCVTHWYPMPSRMTLTKKKVAMAAQHWSSRLADAQELLKTIGTDEEISRIMGERYDDVVKALEGSQPFTRREEDEGGEGDEAMVGIE
jgi:hypothetical protein